MANINANADAAAGAGADIMVDQKVGRQDR